MTDETEEEDENKVEDIDVILVPQWGAPETKKVKLSEGEFRSLIEDRQGCPLVVKELDDGCSVWFRDRDTLPEEVELNHLITLHDTDEYNGFGGVRQKVRMLRMADGGKEMIRGAFIVAGATVWDEGNPYPSSIGPISTKKYLKLLG